MSGCDLQYSNDAGSTWTTVTSWVGFPNSCQTFPPPPNPGGATTAQQACNIASWLAEEVIQNGLTQVSNGISTGVSLLDTAAIILDALPGIDLVAGVGASAAAIIFAGVASIGTSIIDAAIADTTLQTDIKCAILSAIVADGYVTDANFATIIANVNAVSYSTPAVIGLIVNYLNSLGAKGLEAIQAQGSLNNADCTACGHGVTCAIFNGSTDYLDVTGLNGMTPGPISIIGWLALSSSGLRVILSHDRSAGNGGLIAFHALSGTPTLDLYQNNGTTAYQVSTSTAASPAAVAMTFDGSTGKIYINGTLVQTTGSLSTWANDGTQLVQIGRQVSNSLYAGKMSDLRVYAGALSATDVATYAAAGVGAYPALGSATLLAQWKFNEGSGSTAADSSGNAHIASWNGTGARWSTW